MRRKEKEITDKEVIEEILSKSEICRLAINGEEGIPYIVALNYGYADNVIYFHSAPTGKKIELLKQKNLVCFEMEYGVKIIKGETSCNWSTKYRSIIGYGKVEIITGREQKKNGLNIIMMHNGKGTDNVFDDKHLENLVILKLTIDEISGKQSGNWD